MKIKSHKDNIHYNIEHLLPYQRLIYFICGNRSSGKSFSIKDFLLREYFNKGKKFIYLVRYVEDIKRLKFNGATDIFQDMLPFYSDVIETIKISDKQILINDEICGYIVALSSVTKLKRISSFTECDYVFFDEFLNEDKDYLKNEVELFLNFYQTISRGQGKTIRHVTVFFASNSISVSNPYFNYFNIRPKIGLTVTDWYVLDFFVNEDVNEQIKQSQFYSMISNTKYARYAMNNDFYLDNSNFVENKNLSECKYLCTLIYKKVNIGIWVERSHKYLYASEKYDKLNPYRYALTTDDNNINALLLERKKKTPILDTLRTAFKVSQFYFESQQIKNLMLDIFNFIE